MFVSKGSDVIQSQSKSIISRKANTHNTPHEYQSHSRSELDLGKEKECLK